MNFLQGRIGKQTGQGAEIMLDGGSEAFVPCKQTRDLTGQHVTLGIRPENLLLGGSGPSAVSGKVFNVERLGGDTYLYVKQESGNDLTVHAPGDVVVRIGDDASFSFDNSKCHLFSEDGDALERLCA
jgi:multiple sugar transport system ATP-binding protein